jgi:hypothetical protein
VDSGEQRSTGVVIRHPGFFGRLLRKPLPLIGHLSVGTQLQILGGALLVLFVMVGIVTFVNDLRVKSGSAYAHANAEISMLSQRLGCLRRAPGSWMSSVCLKTAAPTVNSSCRNGRCV